MSPNYHVTIEIVRADLPEFLTDFSGYKIIKIELVEEKS